MVAIGPLQLRNPVILSSGIFGAAPEKLQAAYRYGAGAVVTKSITPEPREGNPEPNIKEYDDGSCMNWVGLRNPGADRFAQMLGRPDYPVIVSLAGSIPSDFGYMAGMFRGVAGFELNVSCPNVAGMGNYIGSDPVLTADVVRAVKQATKLPIFVKLGHGMFDAAGAAKKAGADGITAINTIPGMYIDTETEPPSIQEGGISGPAIKGFALRFVRDVVRTYGIPVIGCGGVSTSRDVLEYMAAGASAVQVGTAAMRDMSVLGRIAKGLPGAGA